MKELTFTYQEQKFTINLERGELYGEEGEAMAALRDSLNGSMSSGYCGQDYYPWKGMEITDPYRDIYQFAACVLDASWFKVYPPELEPYMPEFHEPYPVDENAETPEDMDIY